MKKSTLIFSTIAVLLLGAMPVTSALAASDDSEYVFVQFQDAPAATYEGTVTGLARTKPASGKFNASSAEARSYHSYLESAHVKYRAWLTQNAPKAQVLHTYKTVFNGMAIKLDGESADKVATGPGVKAWAYRAMYRPTMTQSVKVIGAPTLWGANRANAGKGLVVGVIDSGIADAHPFFACKGGGGTGAIRHFGPYFTGDAALTNGLPTIFGTHGTHVAGTIGGCVASLDAINPGGVVHGTISGLAPAVTLWDFNVFPGLVGEPENGASDVDIAAAVEDAVAAGVDVINMSLGGPAIQKVNFLEQVCNNTVDAGVVVCIAAGNDGDFGEATIGSPGAARKVITAGASSNPHFAGVPVHVGAATYGGVLGDFDGFGNNVTRPYTVTTPTDGCTPISQNLTGRIGLIDRGTCTFSTKILNAETNHAVGVLIANNRAGEASPMAIDDTLPFPGIPAMMLSQDDANAIKPSGTMSINGTNLAEFITTRQDIQSSFSSQGPTVFNYFIKPDVMAPGQNVYSSIFNLDAQNHKSYTFEFFDGTSMATPHTAGSAVLLLEKHPTWSPADVKSALEDTAARVITDALTATVDPGVMIRGGGRISLPDANATPLTCDPANSGFGLQKGNGLIRQTVNVRVHNVSGVAQTANVSVTGGSIVTASPAILHIAPGATVTVRVTLNAGRRAQTPTGDYDGDVIIAAAGKQLRVPWWVRILRNP